MTVLSKRGILKGYGAGAHGSRGASGHVHEHLCKARKSWARISHILARGGVTPRVPGMFYKAVVQSILLFGSETWVVTKPMLQALEGFYHRVARRTEGEHMVTHHERLG
eukprot:scaffold28024_cov58-Attheya_sp.AAC.1